MPRHFRALALLSAGLFPMLGAAPADAQQMFKASNRAEVMAALSLAKGGDTVYLAPGDYGDLVLSRRKFRDGQVTIRSAMGTDRARVGRITMLSTEGIMLAGLDIASAQHPVVLIGTQARNLTLAGNRIRGADADRDPWNNGNAGIWVRDSFQVKLISNDFQDLRVAAYVQRSADVSIRHNSLSFLREGLNIASLDRGDISHNHIHSFFPRYDLREHSDAIQFWTRGETWGTRNVSVLNNFIAMGGSRAVQGIFINSEAAPLGVRFTNLEVSGNVYYGSSLHGITLHHVDGARLANNVSVSSPWADQNNMSLRFADGRSSGGLEPQIRVLFSTAADLARNIGMRSGPSGAGITSVDHMDLFDTARRSGAAWTDVFVAPRPTEESPPLAAFTTLDPSFAASRGMGMLKPFPVGVVTLDPGQAVALAKAN